MIKVKYGPEAVFWELTHSLVEEELTNIHVRLSFTPLATPAPQPFSCCPKTEQVKKGITLCPVPIQFSSFPLVSSILPLMYLLPKESQKILVLHYLNETKLSSKLSLCQEINNRGWRKNRKLTEC